MSFAFDNVSKNFGAVVAIREVSLTFEPGRIYSIIGPNGAGKSTLINMAAGSYSVTSGDILLDGRRLTALKKYQISRAGIARTYQNIRLFDHMTALENLEVCLYREQIGHVVAEILLPARSRALKADRTARSMEALRRFGLEAYGEQPATSLPYGSQKLLEIARAIMTQPKVLMLDEPAAGLNMSETAELREKLVAMRSDGLIMIVIEHDMNLVMSISDHIYVLHQGRTLAEGSAADIQSNKDVQEAYLGSAGELDEIKRSVVGRQNRVRIRLDAGVVRHRSRGVSR